MNQPPAAHPAHHATGLRISFADARRRLSAQSADLLRDRALWVCLGVVALSLLSAYVVVLRDAVRNGEVVRSNFAQQAQGGLVKVQQPTQDTWLAAAPTAR